LLLSSVLHSQQIQHSLSTAAVTAEAEVVLTAAAASVVVAEAVFTAAEAPMLAADFMAAIAGFVAAASMAARGLLAEEVTTKAAGWELAVV
jgi:hypothetical protein